MASKFPAERDEKFKLRPRIGHDMAWSCDKHGEPIKFYCKEHKIPICHPCATKDHGQKLCELDDIEDVILERRRKLDDKLHELEETKKPLHTLESKIESVASFSSNHLQTVNDEVRLTSKNKLKSVKDKELDRIRSINEEADKEIRIINKRRKRRIKLCNEEAEQNQIVIKESHEKVLSETEEIRKVVSKKLKYLTRKNQHAISSVDNVKARIKRIKQEDKTLMNAAPQLLASLDDNLRLIVHQDVSEYLDRIQREVQRVKFVEGEVGGEHYGRIDGYIGKWELVKSIDIPWTVENPRVRGLISDDEICVVDVRNDSMYVTNISTEHTEKVIEGDRSITSCAYVDVNLIVCGKGSRHCTGDILDRSRYITIYDRQWKVIRDIAKPWTALPRTTRNANMHVDVDRDGMVLVGQGDHSNIYVIDPDDGKIVNIITMQGKEVYGEIQALSSGDIVVETDNDDFTVISRSGEEKAVIHAYIPLDISHFTQCRVDKLTDTLYITYWDEERNVYAVDQVSCDGIIQARRIVEYEQSVRYSIAKPCLVSPSGDLVVCNGDNFCVFKKRFIV